MTEGLPPKLPPPAPLRKLRELEARWGEVVDWVIDATTDARHYRTEAFAEAHLFYVTSAEARNLDKYQRVIYDIDRSYFRRLAEIDETDSAFKAAYETVRADFRNTPEEDAEMEAYSIAIRPHVIAARLENQRRLNDMQLEKANKKTELYRARDERRQRRLERRIAQSEEDEG